MHAKIKRFWKEHVFFFCFTGLSKQEILSMQICVHLDESCYWTSIVNKVVYVLSDRCATNPRSPQRCPRRRPSSCPQSPASSPSLLLQTTEMAKIRYCTNIMLFNAGCVYKCGDLSGIFHSSVMKDLPDFAELCKKKLNHQLTSQNAHICD